VTLEDFNEAWSTYCREASALASRYSGQSKTEHLLNQMYCEYATLHQRFIKQGCSLAFIWPRFHGVDKASFELMVNPVRTHE